MRDSVYGGGGMGVVGVVYTSQSWDTEWRVFRRFQDSGGGGVLDLFRYESAFDYWLVRS